MEKGKIMEMGAFQLSDEQLALAEVVRRVCSKFDEKYWIKEDAERRYPSEFVDELTRAGLLSLMIPEEYGGGGGSLVDAAVMLEAINRTGATGLPAHAQMYTMGMILRHGSDEQKGYYLPKIAAGELRLQSFAITEPDAGSDTTKISTRAVRSGDEYIINGAKMWTSRVQHSDLMFLLARTSPFDPAHKTDGMSVFLVDLTKAGDGIEVSPIKTMVSHETNSLFISDLRVPVENRIGEEGKGFKYILSGLNAERVLVASEVLGDGYWLVEKAAAYSKERVVFDRPIGANQAIQFPIAQAYAQLEAASLMRFKAAALYDAGEQPGFEANAAKLLASQATWDAANAAMTTFGGNGMADEYGIHRKFREARLQLIAPVSNNLVLNFIGTRVLGMPRSY